MTEKLLTGTLNLNIYKQKMIYCPLRLVRYAHHILRSTHHRMADGGELCLKDKNVIRLLITIMQQQWTFLTAEFYSKDLVNNARGTNSMEAMESPLVLFKIVKARKFIFRFSFPAASVKPHKIIFLNGKEQKNIFFNKRSR